MSDNKALIAEAWERLTVSRLGRSIMRETDKDLIVIRRLVGVLEKQGEPSDAHPAKYDGKYRCAICGGKMTTRLDAWVHVGPPLAGVVAEEPEQVNRIRATAVREAAAYLDRITRPGLLPKQGILGDLEAVAYRMSEGMTARGSNRVPGKQGGESDV